MSLIKSLNTKVVSPLDGYWCLNMAEVELYQQLYNYALTLEEQRKYGYPVSSPFEPGRAYIEGFDEPNDPSQRVCCRCSSPFQVSNQGEYIASNSCIYHWGKKCKDVSGVSSVYICCGQNISSPGCTFSKFHVCARSVEELDGFVTTRVKHNGSKNYGVYALDCEMCFTVKGLEVVKVSVVGPDGVTIYNSFVAPSSKILDYNTKFSGIMSKDLKNVKTTLQDVQTVLLKLFNSRTILIGHGLENDLKALKMIHETVVDTSVVFPHYYGLPFRRSLKSLINSYLRRNIQNGVGHDSLEDARACMELMLWKVSKDHQLREKRRNKLQSGM